MRTVVSLRRVSESRDSITDIWGQRAPHRGEWPVRVDERITEESDRWVGAVLLGLTGEYLRWLRLRGALPRSV
jgi:hypothetical protein